MGVGAGRFWQLQRGSEGGRDDGSWWWITAMQRLFGGTKGDGGSLECRGVRWSSGGFNGRTTVVAVVAHGREEGSRGKRKKVEGARLTEVEGGRRRRWKVEGASRRKRKKKKGTQWPSKENCYGAPGAS